jgi:hypothetical protein
VEDDGKDIFLHELATNLAIQATNTCQDAGVDISEEGLILHLGQAFMLSLRVSVRVRKSQ